MQVVGSVIGAIQMFETCVIPSLLNNASVWVGSNETHYKMLDSLQYEFVRALLQVPGSTPLACLRGATGLRGMKWRVWEAKLLLVLAIRQQDEGVLVTL